MNEFVAERFVENVRRLALGVEPRDLLRGRRVAHSIEVMLDGLPLAPPRSRRPADTGPFTESDVLRRLPRHSSCRHVLLFEPGIPAAVDLRIVDRSYRLAPRRLRVNLRDPELDDPPPETWPRRTCRPALLPGAAYDVSQASTGLRGRVTRPNPLGDAPEEVPLRWARVEAVRPSDGVRVGLAHGDAYGEFLLLLAPAAQRGMELSDPLPVQVTVFGPDTAPGPAADPASAVDPLWDLPLEEVPLPGTPDLVSAAEALPDGYVSRSNSSRVVEFRLGRFGREIFQFHST